MSHRSEFLRGNNCVQERHFSHLFNHLPLPPSPSATTLSCGCIEKNGIIIIIIVGYNNISRCRPKVKVTHTDGWTDGPTESLRTNHNELWRVLCIYFYNMNLVFFFFWRGLRSRIRLDLKMNNNRVYWCVYTRLVGTITPFFLIIHFELE